MRSQFVFRQAQYMSFTWRQVLAKLPHVTRMNRTFGGTWIGRSPQSGTSADSLSYAVERVLARDWAVQDSLLSRSSRARRTHSLGLYIADYGDEMCVLPLLLRRDVFFPDLIGEGGGFGDAGGERRVLLPPLESHVADFQVSRDLGVREHVLGDEFRHLGAFAVPRENGLLWPHIAQPEEAGSSAK
jgi:hypothetical protein